MITILVGRDDVIYQRRMLVVLPYVRNDRLARRLEPGIDHVDESLAIEVPVLGSVIASPLLLLSTLRKSSSKDSAMFWVLNYITDFKLYFAGACSI